MGSTSTIPTLSLDSGLTHYLTEIRKFPMLKPDEETAYAKRLRDKGDREAAYHLVTSHLRLVAKIAMRYRGYGLPIADIISEGNVGLMQAVKRFEPERGFRLATYAMWWIKASIQEYVLRSWSLVKLAQARPRKSYFSSFAGPKPKSPHWKRAIFIPSTPNLSPTCLAYRRLTLSK